MASNKNHNGTGRTHRVNGSQQPQYFLGRSREFWKTVMGPKRVGNDAIVVPPEADAEAG